ncbi:MAG: hypothetical protein J2P36_17700 [Ktedonobacteraceae bacterium]|nr:hypothetical protein [Ktedonobacteraceae bacterium]
MGAPLLASRSQELRNLIDRLLQQVPQLVIVATCRSEYCDRVRAALGKVLAKLQELHVPSFSTNQGSTQVRQIITAFQNVAQHEPEQLHIEDWDGTLGSLVLGLSTKRDQYLALPEHLKVVLTLACQKHRHALGMRRLMHMPVLSLPTRLGVEGCLHRRYRL